MSDVEALRTVLALEEVTGSQAWETCRYNDANERRLIPYGLAWFRRCCGHRMIVMRWRYRRIGAGKFPVGSRAHTTQWWGSRAKYRCAKCGWEEAYSS